MGPGTGSGLEVHEEPRIVRRRPDSDLRDEYLAAGMVFTIEPGAYFPGLGRRPHRRRCGADRNGR